MAEDHLKRSASFGSTRRDDPTFEEDPLIELARIVAEDGGFRRQRAPDLRPARNETGPHEIPPRSTHYDSPAREEAIANQLEAELMQEWNPMRAEPVHVSLRPAGGAPVASQRFPEIVIEDARPPRPDEPEPFEAELSALFADADPDRGGGAYPEEAAAAEAARGPDETTDPIPFAEYEERFEDGYSAEIQDFETPHDGATDLDPDEFFDEADTAAPAAERREPARRSYKGVIAAVGVLAVVVVGGAVAAVVGGVSLESDGSPPPVIRAETGPAKVESEESAEAQAGDGAGQAVYDRVAGRAPKSEEKLVERSEEPQQISRVVLPGAESALQGDETASSDQGDDGTADGASAQEQIGGQISSETPSMQSGPRVDPVGPRRVRTVTVRPDGSIASTPARVAEARPQLPGSVETDFSGADAPDPVPVRTVRIESEGVGPSRSLQSESPEAPASSADAPQPFSPLAGRVQPEPEQGAPADVSEAAAEEASEPAPPSEEQVAMLPRARPDDVPAAFLRPAAAQSSRPQQGATQPAAASRSGDPVDLLAAGPASPRSQAQQPQPSRQATQSASPSGGFAVQLSAQRSEEQARATFASLRNQYPSILGSQQPQIERADLGDRGVYYRVRVGAGSQAEANQLCEQLKAAGGSCFVTR